MKTFIKFLAIILILGSFNSYSQHAPNKWKNPSRFPTYQYFQGKSEPVNGWNSKIFDDSSWNTGLFGIGYGDGDDSTLVDTVTTVYLRYKLSASLKDLTNLKALILYADFDDGYIAYLNGKEVLRVNIEPAIVKPTNTTTTIRSHEAELYRNVFRPVQGYYINADLLKSCNLDTTNVLAFEVHNDSIKGSDLSFNFGYEFYNNSFTYNYFNYQSRFVQQVPFDSTNIPIIVIETSEYGYNLDKGSTAKMGIINNGPGRYNKLTDAYADYNGLISIKVRGNRSKDYPKASYRIELQDSLGENNNVSIFGMAEENDFVLYGPYSDESLIHNEIAFELGRKLSYYVPRTKFCELIVNGKELGMYVFTENIKLDKNRVNISKISKNDNFGNNLTGGYMFGYDSGWEFKIFYPSSEDITPEQSDYINRFLERLHKILYSDNFMDPFTGYKQYIDVESYTDYIIVNEAVKNREAYIQSTYMTKDRDDINGKIHYGPLWDFDNSLGYALYGDVPANGWRFGDAEVNTIDIKRVLQDTSFTHLLAKKWHKYRQDIYSNDSIFNFINKLVDTLRPSIDRNYKIWPIKGLADYGNHPLNKGITYDDEITKMNRWLNTHLAWIDANIDKLVVPLVKYNGIDEVDGNAGLAYCYPNPFKDNLTLTLTLRSSGSVKLEVYDISGKKLKQFDYKDVGTGEKYFRIDLTDIRDAGMYVLKVSKDNIPVVNQRIAKIK